VDQELVRVLSGHRNAFADLLRRIPPALLSSSPELALCGVSARYLDGDRAGVVSMLRLARTLADGQEQVAASTEMMLRLTEAGTYLWRRGAMTALVEASTETLRRLTAYRTDELPALLHYRAVALARPPVVPARR